MARPGFAEAPHQSLPLQLSSFIGREREIGEVEHKLADSRLVTLTGPGGCGKTRLALQVAARLDAAHAFEHGIGWAELAALSDPALVPQTAARALSVTEAPDRSWTETLSAFLRPKSFLLILDNCEHLRPACVQLAETLLLAAPDLHILATSREPLAVPGETAWLTPSLSLPSPRDLTLPTTELLLSLTHFDAIRLFVDRAASVRPTFTLTDRNAAAVAQVCRRLDGIPLAIELAAARVNVLTVEQIAARLDDAFALLTGGSRSALLPRHATLRAAMEWSHDLLSEREQLLFRRLAVFAGGCELEAMEAVCSGNGLERKEVLEVLSRLVDKSLVVADTEGMEARYWLLETIRQYAWERLVESGEETEVRDRHLEWFLALAEETVPKLQGAEQRAWLDRLEREHDNFRAALGWSLEAREPERGLRLATALGSFWGTRGYWTEGRGLFEKTLARTEAMKSSLLRAKAAAASADLARLQGDYSTARSLNEQALAMGRALGDQQVIASSLNGLGHVAWAQGDYELAGSLFAQVLEIWRELGDQGAIARALNNLGLVAYRQGDYASARSLYQEGLAIKREAGDRSGIATALNNLGIAAQELGEYAEARLLLEENLAINRDLNDKLGTARALNNLGNLLRSMKDYSSARTRYEESLAMYQALADRGHRAYPLFGLGRVAYHQANYAAARSFYAESLAVRQASGDRQGIIVSLEGFAKLASAFGELQQAARLFGAAEVLRETLGHPQPPAEQAEYNQEVAVLRSRLPGTTLGEAWAEGRAMTLEQAVQTALSVEAQPVSTPSRTLPGQPLAEPLTERELEVLRLVAAGHSNQEIARELVVAVGTVKRHVNSVFGKLGAGSRTQAVARARDLGLL